MACHSNWFLALTVIAAAWAIAVALPTVSGSTVYIVGDEYGWSVGVNYTAWAYAKNFFGPLLLLLFRYPKGEHNVPRVTGLEFQACRAAYGSPTTLTSGHDVITLATPGRKWYFCGVSGHCNMGQKMVITVWPAAAISPAPAALPVPGPSQWRPSMAPSPALVPIPTPAPAPEPGMESRPYRKLPAKSD